MSADGTFHIEVQQPYCLETGIRSYLERMELKTCTFNGTLRRTESVSTIDSLPSSLIASPRLLNQSEVGAESPQSPCTSKKPISPLYLHPAKKRSFILYLEPSAGGKLSKLLQEVTLSVVSSLGSDPSHCYHAHCSLTSFFEIPDEEANDNGSSNQRYGSVDCVIRNVMLTHIFGDSSGADWHDEALNTVISRQPRFKILNQSKETDNHDSFGGSDGVVCTPEGYVIFPLRCDLLQECVREISRDLESRLNSRGGAVVTKVQPKTLGHITLASNRREEEQAAIADYYGDVKVRSLLDCAEWDIVAYELQHRSECFKSNGLHRFREVLRISHIAA